MYRGVIHSILQTVITVLPVLFLVNLADELNIYRRSRDEDQNRNEKLESQDDSYCESMRTNRKTPFEKLRSTLQYYIVLGVLYFVLWICRAYDLINKYEKYHQSVTYEYDIFLVAVSVLILYYLYWVPCVEYCRRSSSRDAKVFLDMFIEKLLNYAILEKFAQLLKFVFELTISFLLLSSYVICSVNLFNKYNIRTSFFPLLGLFGIYYYIGPRIIEWFFQKPLPAVIHFCMTILRILTGPICYLICKSTWVQKLFNSLLERMRSEFDRTIFFKKSVHKLSCYFSELLKDSNLRDTLKQKTYLSLLLISAFELSNGEGAISGVLGLLFLFDTYLKKEI